MPRGRQPYPVVDVFAGPGGLGEGFASLRDGKDRTRFNGVIAIERDEHSHRTLLLRHFLHACRDGIPEEYYDYLAGRITLEEIYRAYPSEFNEARGSALRISLGPESRGYVRRSITGKLKDQSRWVLVGGPPCQAYSLVGRSRMSGRADFEEDERHFLYREYLQIISDHRPPVFVMENVKGLLSAEVKGHRVIDRIVADLSSPHLAISTAPKGLRYRLYSLSEADMPDGIVDPRLFLVRAEDHGVPQARHRMFIVGVRSDLKLRPRLLKRHKGPTVRETIGTLPAIRSGLSGKHDNAGRWLDEITRLENVDVAGQLNGAPYSRTVVSEIRTWLKKPDWNPEHRRSTRYPRRPGSKHPALVAIHDPSLDFLTAHEARTHMPSDLRRYMYAAIFADATGRSPKLSDFPRSLLPDHRNVHLGRTGKMFSDRFRVQLPDQVSTTITSHISKDGHYFIHYDPAQCRSLTVREAARLQTFPDNYSFQGPRTSQYHQVGNAVPPYLARQIAEIVAELLDAMKGET